jgi:hypothetical protein
MLFSSVDGGSLGRDDWMVAAGAASTVQCWKDDNPPHPSSIQLQSLTVLDGGLSSLSIVTDVDQRTLENSGELRTVDGSE